MVENKILLRETTIVWVQVVLTKRRRCVVCGSWENLDVHHFWPKGQFAHLRFDPDNGVTLCRYHHQNVNTFRDKVIASMGRPWYDRLDQKRRHPPQFFAFNNKFVVESLAHLKTLPNGFPGVCRDSIIEV